MPKKRSENTVEIPLTLIDIPMHIDREEIDPDYIHELASSIRELTLLQPIVVRPVGERYELIAGHRRYLAHQELERLVIMANVRALTDNEAILARAVENLQRVDLTIIEEARVYKAMVDTLGLTIDQIASKLGKSSGMVRRKISLLSLVPCLQQAIHKGQIIYSVGEELNSLGDPGKIEYLLGFCIDHGATLGVVRSWVADEKSKQRQKVLESGGQGSEVVIPRSVPVYVACDLCLSPMSIGQETVIRCCPACAKQLQEIAGQNKA